MDLTKPLLKWVDPSGQVEKEPILYFEVVYTIQRDRI